MSWYFVIHTIFAIVMIGMLWLGNRIDNFVEQRKFNERMGYIWKDF